MAKMYETTLEIVSRYTARFEAESQKEAEAVLDMLEVDDIDMISEGQTETVSAQDEDGEVVFVVTCDEEKTFNIFPKPKEIAS